MGLSVFWLGKRPLLASMAPPTLNKSLLYSPLPSSLTPPFSAQTQTANTTTQKEAALHNFVHSIAPNISKSSIEAKLGQRVVRLVGGSSSVRGGKGGISRRGNVKKTKRPAKVKQLKPKKPPPSSKDTPAKTTMSGAMVVTEEKKKYVTSNRKSHKNHKRSRKKAAESDTAVKTTKTKKTKPQKKQRHTNIFGESISANEIEMMVTMWHAYAEKELALSGSDFKTLLVDNCITLTGCPCEITREVTCDNQTDAKQEPVVVLQETANTYTVVNVEGGAARTIIKREFDLRLDFGGDKVVIRGK